MKTFVDSFSQNCDPRLSFFTTRVYVGLRLKDLFVRSIGSESIFIFGLFLGPPGSAVRGGAPLLRWANLQGIVREALRCIFVLLEDHKC